VFIFTFSIRLSITRAILSAERAVQNSSSKKKEGFVVKTVKKRMATDSRSACLWFQRAGEDVVVLSTK